MIHRMPCLDSIVALMRSRSEFFNSLSHKPTFKGSIRDDTGYSRIVIDRGQTSLPTWKEPPAGPLLWVPRTVPRCYAALMSVRKVSTAPLSWPNFSASSLAALTTWPEA